MADISCIKLPNGEKYNIKDAEARRQIELLLGPQNLTSNSQKERDQIIQQPKEKD